MDLNGRFFGGRTVRACFYNLDKFRRFHLGDPIEWLDKKERKKEEQGTCVKDIVTDQVAVKKVFVNSG